MGSCLNARKTAFAFALVTAILTAAQVVQAVPVTFAFSGIIDRVSDYVDYFDGSIVAGGTYWGTYTFESSMVDDDPSPMFGIYRLPAPPSSITIVHAGNYTFTGPTSGVYVENQVKDSYGMSSQWTEVSGLETFVHVSLQDFDYPGTALNSDALPLLPPTLQDFEYRSFALRAELNDYRQYGFVGSVESLTLVPEPGSAGLLILGVLSCIAKRRILL